MPRKPVELTEEQISSIIRDYVVPSGRSDDDIASIRDALRKFRKIVPKHYEPTFASKDAESVRYFDSVYNQAVDSVESHLNYGGPVQKKGRKSPKLKKTATAKKRPSPKPVRISQKTKRHTRTRRAISLP